MKLSIILITFLCQYHVTFDVFRYPNIACDLITSDVSQLTDALAASELLMNAVYSFLDTDDLNPLQASFFSKLMGLLITRKSEMVCDISFTKLDCVIKLTFVHTNFW
jgi:serine/threonine-protein phosphatase 6 regulatory subunit 1